MNWDVVVDKQIEKFLKKIGRRDKERLIGAMQEFSADPYAGDVEKMEGEENVWRRRIGAFRIFYELYPSKKIVYVFSIKRRASNTY
ncbi:MAG TPA: type II toxin-antitoxin system RelE/ParE family toxin [Candidatus Paceibacterota bacterium]